MQDAIEKVTRTITGEWAAGAIGAMGSGSKAQNQQPRPGIAKTGYRPGPIIPVKVSTALYASDFLTVFNQPGAASAGSNLMVEINEAQL